MLGPREGTVRPDRPDPGGSPEPALTEGPQGVSEGDVPGYGPATFGDRWAEAYDAWTELRLPGEAEPTVEFLASVAGDGPVLELAIGTGRIALPLRERGLDVRGIDASEAMVAKLREKPGGADIPVYELGR